MKRLAPGEYQRMTPEQQLEHRRLLRNRWLRKKGNKDKVREWNRRYLHKYWIKKKETPVMRVCKKCGKTVALTGKKTICDECRAIPSQTRLKQQAIKERTEARKYRDEEILRLNKIGCFTQTQIAQQVGTCQEVVSRVLRKTGIVTQAHQKRGSNE